MGEIKGDIIDTLRFLVGNEVLVGAAVREKCLWGGMVVMLLKGFWNGIGGAGKLGGGSFKLNGVSLSKPFWASLSP